jgi:pimeloyl-ACP methyl ester carboxylesterase
MCLLGPHTRKVVQVAQATLTQATIDYRVLGPENSPHPPVLFVHGGLVDQRVWGTVPDELARKGFRCIVPTWPMGAHTIAVNDGADLSPRGLAAMIRDFVVALDLSDVTLVGNDNGGALCQFVIDAYPDRIGRMVLTNCDAFETFPPFPFNAIFALLRGPKSIKTIATLMRWRALRHSPLGFGLLVTSPDPELTASWLEPCRTDSRICRDLASALRHIANTDLSEVSSQLTRFTKPVTLLWGMRDRCFKPSLATRLAAQLPNATVVEAPDAKTFVALDSPSILVDIIATASTHGVTNRTEDGRGGDQNA